MNRLFLIAIAATIAATSAIAQSPSPSVKSESSAVVSPQLRLEKTYVQYIAAQEAILAKRPDRRADIGGKIAATKFCLSQLRKEFGLTSE